MGYLYFSVKNRPRKPESFNPFLLHIFCICNSLKTEAWPPYSNSIRRKGAHDPTEIIFDTVTEYQFRCSSSSGVYVGIRAVRYNIWKLGQQILRRGQKWTAGYPALTLVKEKERKYSTRPDSGSVTCRGRHSG